MILTFGNRPVAWSHHATTNPLLRIAGPTVPSISELDWFRLRRDLGAWSDVKFVVSSEGEAYSAHATGPSTKFRSNDSRTAKRPQTTHAVVRVLQGIRRTEENSSVAHSEWWKDRIPYAGKFLQSETGSKESACCVLCGERGWSSDFWNGANHYRPKRSSPGLPKLLEGSPGADGDCDRTSSLDRDAVEQACGGPGPAGRAESPRGTDRSYDLNSETVSDYRTYRDLIVNRARLFPQSNGS